jgi:hypothetical protein
VGARGCRRLPGVLSRLGTKIALGLAAASASAAVAAPTAIGGVVPWGAGCSPVAASATRTSANCGAELGDGRAIAPPGAPAAVKEVIAAANQIDGRPYVWGGGHLSFFTKGYDCSGAVSYALHGAGLLEATMVSGQLATWGEAGVGEWITVYANAEHVYMVVAGLRFDTRDDLPGVSGPRWKMASADPHGFVPRHPPGL